MLDGEICYLIHYDYLLMICCITERARIEAQIKTAEAAERMRAEEESRKQREKEREAARAAIEKVLFLSLILRYCNSNSA
jgi:hypothetical protein